MAIKKTFVLTLVFVVIFSLCCTCFAVDYFVPTQEEFQLLTENVFYQSTYSFGGQNIIELPTIDVSSIVFPSTNSNQVFLIYTASNNTMFCYPVRSSYLFFPSFNSYIHLFGTYYEDLDGGLFLDPDYDMGLGFIDAGDLVLVQLLCQSRLVNQSGLVALSYLPRTSNPFVASVNNGLDFIISGFGNLFGSVLSPGGILFPLMQLLLLGVSITFLLFAVKIIRKFTWGD